MADNFFKVRNGISLGNLATDPLSGVNGDVYYNTVSNTIREFVNGAWTDAVETSNVQILTNKTLSGNTATNLINGAGTIDFNSSGTVTVPNVTDTLVGKATTDILTNKTLAFLRTSVNTDSTTTGIAATLLSADILVGVARLTNASLKSFSGIPAGVAGQQLTIENQTGSIINVNNNDAGATAANRIFTGTGALVQMPVNASFTFTYDAVLSRWMLVGGTGSGSGSGGGKNYLTAITASTSSGIPNTGNGNAELGSTTGFSLGTTGALTNGLPTGTPTFGSGASGNLSLGVVSTGQIAGLYSFSYASSAATTVGNMMASDAFFIDTEDQAKVLNFSINYLVHSGAANDNFSGTSANSFGVAVYDVTNSVWLPVSNPFSFTQITGVGNASGSFQTAINTTELRFVFYNANATTGATTIYLDNISVGSQGGISSSTSTNIVAMRYYGSATSFSSPVAVAYSTKDFDTNNAYSGSTYTVPVSGVYRVTGSVDIDWTGSVGSFKISIYKNGSLHSQFIEYTTIANVQATPQITDTVSCIAGDTIQIYLDSTMTGTAIGNDPARDFIAIELVSGSSQIFSDGDSGTVAAYANNLIFSGSVSSSGTITVFPSMDKDTYAAYNTSTGEYTVPISGFYNVFAGINIVTTFTSFGEIVSTALYKNNIVVKQSYIRAQVNVGSPQAYQVELTDLIYANAGDILDIRSSSTGSSSYYSDGSLSFQRVSGLSAMTASETVALTAHSTTGMSVPAGASYTKKTFDTIDINTHNAWSNNTFTTPRTGIYQVSYNDGFHNTSGAINFMQIAIYKNGAIYARASTGMVANPYDNTNCVSVSIKLNAGDTIECYILQSDLTAMTTLGNNVGFISIISG